MNRSLIAACIGAGVSFAAFLALIVMGIMWYIPVLIAVGAVMVLVSLWVLTGFLFRERLYEGFEKKFRARDFAGALTLVDRAESNHFLFPLLRILVYECYVKGELAVDNVSQSAKYVQLLRHNGGKGWKYRTAFYTVLFNLDWGDVAAAQEEFAEFEAACSHSPKHREELEILRALLLHVMKVDVPYPDSVKNSPYPVVKRIVERDYL